MTSLHRVPLLLVCLLGAGLAWADVIVSTYPEEVITLAWDANPPEENVTGYLVYFGGASRFGDGFEGYAVEIDVGNVTEHTFIVPSGYISYYFAAVAYNDWGLRSEYSDELTRPPDAPSGPKNMRRQ